MTVVGPLLSVVSTQRDTSTSIGKSVSVVIFVVPAILLRVSLREGRLSGWSTWILLAICLPTSHCDEARESSALSVLPRSQLLVTTPDSLVWAFEHFR